MTKLIENEGDRAGRSLGPVIPSQTIELLQESAVITTRTIALGRVSIRTVTDEVAEIVNTTLSGRKANVERIAVDRIVDAIPQTRVEDGVTIVPVFEEVLVVERRIRLVEELHIRHEETSESVRLPVTVRRQRAVVERLPVNAIATPLHSTRIATMSNTTDDTMTYNETVTAFFDSRSDAQSAVDRIVHLGVSPTAIKMVEGSDETTSASAPVHERSFFESLGDLFMPDEDKHSYAEGLRRGGYLVSVPTTFGNRDEILDILDDEGTVNMDEREESWRSEGWSGTETGYVAPVVAASSVVGATGTSETYGRTGNVTGNRTANLASGTDRDGTIEVMEENLKVGKRDVSRGRVRVRSYVVEEAVSQDVNLRSERVDIQRRVVDRPVASFDDAFKDQTIELEETAEEAVVSKTARVVEEIDLSKHVSDRTETVSDTVRRTEVAIEDERTGRVSETSNLTGTDTTKVRRDI